MQMKEIGITDLGYFWVKIREIQRLISFGQKLSKMGYAFSRAICITVGFLHPAYRHYKHIKAKAEAEYLSEESEEISKNFDQHWITMAVFCVAEVLSDYLLFWYRLR
jgi:hypothetical protein